MHTPSAAGESGTFVVEIDHFHGPLDLLLHLIREQDIDVLDIPVSRITRQFLEVIEALDLDSAGEFLEMAATLVRIKAQLLLPRPVAEPGEDPRAELVRRLLEYEQVRVVSHRLRSAEAERIRRLAKGFFPLRPAPRAEDAPLQTTWDELLVAALGVAVRGEEERGHRVPRQSVSLEEKVDLILAALEGARRVEFGRLVRSSRGRVHGVMTLLAGLELSRERRVRLRQSRYFRELWICRPEAEDNGAWEDERPAVGSGP